MSGETDHQSADTPLLEADSLGKQFPGVKALDQVSLRVGHGECLAVIGENGAGKSTLMKILAGVQSSDTGEIRVDGKAVQLDSCRAAMDLGIVLIHQELNLADNLDIGSNIFLGREPRLGLFVDHRAIRRESARFLEMVGLDVSPDTLVSRLPIGQQQLVEIAKALSVNARVLIMDEPTSSLSTRETLRLFEVVKDLRKRGVSVIYISHRLGEVRELADRVTVLRDGQNAGDLDPEEITHDNMVRLMVGRDISQFYSRTSHEPGEVLLRADDLVTPEWPNLALNFEVRAGEIVGVAGLVGAGRTEMLQVLFGINPPVSGRVIVAGQPLDATSPRDAIRAGLALVPEDRKQHGLVLPMSIRRNISLPGLHRHQRAMGFRNAAQEASDTKSMIDSMRIRTPGADQVVQFLSGGNQQKVVIGKWLALGPKLLLLDEPTRGIDIGAKQEIYQLMEQLAASGVGILFVSSEMEEILGMSDRTLVMHEGNITGELSRSELSEESIMQLATGNAPPQETSSPLAH
ncbi:MAG: sugar ABC transporter ATP-binding protein [Planctomycetota bacterium]